MFIPASAHCLPRKDTFIHNVSLLDFWLVKFWCQTTLTAGFHRYLSMWHWGQEDLSGGAVSQSHTFTCSRPSRTLGDTEKVWLTGESDHGCREETPFVFGQGAGEAGDPCPSADELISPRGEGGRVWITPSLHHHYPPPTITNLTCHPPSVRDLHSLPLKTISILSPSLLYV